jgi:transposase
MRSIADADPNSQTWALAMADTLADAHHAATAARETGADALDQQTLTRNRSRYDGAQSRG